MEEAVVGRYRWCSRGGHRLLGGCAQGAGIRGVGVLGVDLAAGTGAAGRVKARSPCLASPLEKRLPIMIIFC